MTDQTPIVSALRHDGWTPARRTQFLDHLAADGSVRAACARVGMSRDAAYRLRRREALFARGWDAALVLARAASAEVLANRAIDGVEEEVWYRGELVGTRRKYDSRLLLAHVARLDKLPEDPCAEEDAGRFDEILAVIGGERVTDDIGCDEDGMPDQREDHVEMTLEDAKEAFDTAWLADHPQFAGEEEDDEDRLDPDAAREREAREDELHEAYRQGLAEHRCTLRIAAALRWDAWREQAHAAADRLLARPQDSEASDPCTVSGLSTSAAETAAETAAEAEQDSVAVVLPVSPSPVRGTHPFGVTYARA